MSFARGYTPWNKGKKLSLETRLRMSNHTPWNKGLKMSADYKEKARKAQTGTKKPWVAELNRRRNGKHCHLYKDGRMREPSYVSWLKNRRNRLKRAAIGSHTFGEWEKLKAQCNWSCVSCGREEPGIKLTQDHIIPVSKGGSDNIENIQPLCSSCNSRKQTKIINYLQS